MTDKHQYLQYKNIRKAFLNPEYRGLESNDKELKYDEFSKLLLAQKFILLKCKYPTNFRRQSYSDRLALVVLTRYDSDFHNRSKELTSLLDKLSAIPEIKATIGNNIIELFLITSQLLKKRTIKKIKEYQYFSFNNILSVRFAVELPKANLCNKHEIVSVDEVKKLVEDCYITIDRLKYITEDDAQNIWIGGFPGEVIKITKPSQMAGIAIDYRYVTGVVAKTTDISDNGDEVDEEDNGDPDNE